MRRGGHIITLITIEASWGGTYHRWEPKPGSTAHDIHTALLIIARPTVIRLNVSSTYGNTELGKNNSKRERRGVGLAEARKVSEFKRVAESVTSGNRGDMGKGRPGDGSGEGAVEDG